jgi:hypothetical protein
VPSYRLYRLDGAGNIVGADWLEAQEDEDALREVHERLDGARFELWDRSRLVSSSRGADTPRSRN